MLLPEVAPMHGRGSHSLKWGWDGPNHLRCLWLSQRIEPNSGKGTRVVSGGGPTKEPAFLVLLLKRYVGCVYGHPICSCTHLNDALAVCVKRIRLSGFTEAVGKPVEGVR